MTKLNTAEYYRAREQQERSLAFAASTPDIAAIHRELADRYADLLAQAEAADVPLFQQAISG